MLQGHSTKNSIFSVCVCVCVGGGGGGGGGANFGAYADRPFSAAHVLLIRVFSI